MSEREPEIAVIGGGTGSYTLLSELKQHTPNISAIINMADDGGSTGELRDDLGVLPPGDVRQCLVALSNFDERGMRDQFNYRFTEGAFKGHAWGNLFLSGIEARTGSFSEAVSVASDMLDIRGRVIPSTLDNVQLTAELAGQKIIGETNIGDAEFSKESKPKLALEPAAIINSEAQQALEESDLIVVAPGDLYRSLAPALVVDGMGDALAASLAPVVYVSNLVNKPLHTAEFAVHDYASEVERFAGQAVLEYVLYNTDTPSKEQLQAYALDGEHPVEIDQQALDDAPYKAIGGDFLSHATYQQDENDRLKRSFIRHDGVSIAAALAHLARQHHRK